MATLQLKLLSGNATTADFSFNENGGMIGRAMDCDWILEDPDRYISNRHALISFENNQFVLTDTSSNGIYLNGSSSALGKGSQHVLSPSDSMVMGVHCIYVESIDTQVTQSQIEPEENITADGDLLDLVSAPPEPIVASHEPEFLVEDYAGSVSASDMNDDSDLGLSDILSGKPGSSAPASPLEPSVDYRTPAPEPFAPNHSAQSESEPITDKGGFNSAPVGGIPDDWELSGIMPAVSDIPESPKLDNSREQINLASNEPNSEPAPASQPIPEFQQPAPKTKEGLLEQAPSQNSPVQQPARAELEVDVQLSAKPIPPASQEPSEATPVPAQASTTPPQTSTNQTNDEFLKLLYTKLGLPQAYFDSVDADALSTDIANILLTSTKGLMTLLNGRTAFKQESRMSLTSIQPRSNNPIKFSIDPVDTLEMLMLKKKAEYLDVNAAYEEAISDIQLHQTAFLAGLQATLSGIMTELAPEKIEQEADTAGKSFMGIKSASQYWDLYKKRQQELDAKVKENLNEVLSSYFSDAYQSQIDDLKDKR